jgi:peptidyl-prolyl cis-trans isomerase B (cyclophilin B)
MKQFAIMMCVLILLVGCERKQPSVPPAHDTTMQGRQAPSPEATRQEMGQPPAETDRQTAVPPTTQSSTGGQILSKGADVVKSPATQPAADQEQPAMSDPTAPQASKPQAAIPPGELRAILVTPRGNIRLRLFADQTPMTVANFVNLAQRGFYDGLTFHRVIDDFMVQGGCPKGDGTGNPGYRFGDEIVRSLKHDKPGILSMANSGPGTNGSQFFITHVPTPWLDGKHTVFGEVVDAQDMDVVNKIRKGDRIERVIIEGDVAPLMKRTEAIVSQWNSVLDQRYPSSR